MDKSDLQGKGVGETNRDRVRRLLFAPLAAKGFHAARRPSKGQIGVEAETLALAGIADRLSYMTDGGLEALAECMATKGAGTRRDIWPTPASFETFAEAIEPRPLGEAPALLRWFRSKAGPEALAHDRHVAEYLFWKKRKAPPATPAQIALVRRDAEEMLSQATRLRERRARVGRIPDSDADWLKWYDDLDRKVRALIAQEVPADDAA